MARVREVGAPEGSPQRSLRPPRARTAEKFVKKWGYGGDGAARGTLAPCAPRGWFSPRESRGALPSGSPGAEPRRAPAHAIWPARAAAQWPPQLTPRPSAGLRMPRSPTEVTLPDPTPRQPRQPAGAPVAGRRARRAALEQSCREAGGAQPRAPPRTLPGALARPAALALPPLARPLSAAARSSRTQ